jgi:fermentation-respiration switch protein FrsA (DUF1100 family)
MFLLSRILAGMYLTAPLLAVVLAVWQTRRGKAQTGLPSTQPLFGFMLTLISSVVLSSSIVLIYAHATDARASAGQVALTCYVFVGVLSLLKGFNWLLREGADRLFLLTGRWRIPGPGYRIRSTAAAFTRATVLVGVGLPFIMAIGMVYRPKVTGTDDPLSFGYRFEHVTFDSTDGVRLDAWWVPAAWPGKIGSPKPPDWGTRTVILCHGLGSSKANELMMGRDLPTHGYNVLAFDFRAHGASGGQISSFGDLERQDVLGAVHWVRARHRQQCRQLFGLGVSMGGAALIGAAADPGEDGRAIDAVAVYDTYDDLKSLTEDLTSKFFAPPLPWMSTHLALPLASAHAGTDLANFRPADIVDRIAPRPILVIHARGDEIIDFQHGIHLFDAASEPKLRCWIGKRKVVKKNGVEVEVWLDGDDINADHNGVILSNEANGAVQCFFSWAREIM